MKTQVMLGRNMYAMRWFTHYNERKNMARYSIVYAAVGAIL